MTLRNLFENLPCGLKQKIKAHIAAQIAVSLPMSNLYSIKCNYNPDTLKKLCVHLLGFQIGNRISSIIK